MSPRRRLLVTLVCAAFCAACMSRVHFPYLGGADAAPARAASRLFEYARDGRRVAVERQESRRRTHDVFSVETSSVGDNNQEGRRVRATYYRSRASGLKRLVIVLPIWGSSTYPPKKVVGRLTSEENAAGTNVLWVQGERTIVDWDALDAIATEEELLREVRRAAGSVQATVVDLRKLLDWSLAQGDVDARRIGVIGFSISAIVGSIYMSVDERIDAGVFVMGGAHVHEILATCRGRSADARKHAQRQLGWSVEEYEEALAEPFDPIDPAHYVGAIAPRKVLVFDAGRDRCIPESARVDFWEAMGRPERISLSYGHKIAFLSLSPLGLRYTARRILAFFDENLPVP